MTTEEKQLLLKDLCARLPYRVKINIKSDYTREMEDTELTPYHLDGLGYNAECNYLRPYLRPMSSMTEEEEKECENCFQSDDTTAATLLVDFYNKHHFDYRKLIEKVLLLRHQRICIRRINYVFIYNK